MILSRMLTGVVTAGVIVAGVVLWRLAGVRRARWIIATLAAYGAAAFAHATLNGIPLRAVLGGQGLFRAVPYVLQGAFVGGLVVLPLGWIASVVRAGIPRFREGSPRRNFYQVVALTMCAAIVFISMPLEPRHVTPLPSTSLQIEPPTTPIDPVSLLVRANEIATRVAPVEWDLDVKAETLGAGVEPAFTFVRDAIKYEPYSGVLRGASGTYTARAGNAVDRALLLQRLLARKGMTTRFAIGTLPGEACARLFARAFEDAVSPGPGARVSRNAEGDSLRARIFARSTHDFDRLRQALGSRLLPVTKPEHEQVLAWMNPHVWIQVEVGSRWVDLDTSFGDAEPGGVLTPPDRTVPELPADFFQRLGIRVVAEQLAGHSIVTSTVLDVTRNTVDLVDHQVFVLHTKGRPNPFAGLGSALTHALGGGDPWTPALWIAGEFVFGSNVPASSPEFIAEWLEFDLSWPDGRHEVTRRPLVDRAGAVWRVTHPIDGSALPPLDGDETGPYAMQAVHNVWFSAGPHNLADFAVALQALAAESAVRMVAGVESADATGRSTEIGDAGGEPPAEFPGNVWPFALQNFAWMVWTDHVVIPALNDRQGVRLFPDGARIAVFTITPGPGDQLTVTSDLRRDDLCGLGSDPSNGGVLAEKKLLFGLLQGALEHEALAGLVGASGADPSGVETTSSRAAKHDLVVFASGVPFAVARDRLHPESVARLDEALRAGSTIVAPIAGLDARGSWWEIAAGTGDTRAVGAFGLHSGKGPILGVKNNPGQILKSRGAQQNLFDGVKSFESPAAKAERVADARRLAYESRRMAFEQRAKLRIGNMQSPKAASSATGYTLLAVIGGLIKEFVITAIALWAIEQLVSSVKEFVDTYGDR